MVSQKQEKIEIIKILKYYASDEFKPILPNQLSFRHFRFRTLGGWRKVPIKICEATELQKWIQIFAAADIYYGISTWLNPHKVSAKSGNTGACYHIADNLILSNDLVLDLDAKEPITVKSLNDVRKATRATHNVIKGMGYKLDYAAFSITGETPILTEDGLIPIKEAKKGQKVLTFGGSVGFSEIYDTINHFEEIYELIYENNPKALKLTGNHAIFRWNKTELELIDTKDLTKGDYLQTFNGFDTFQEIPEIEVKYLYRKKLREDKIIINKKWARLIGLSFKTGAKDKRLPGWVFKLPITLKKEIIKGIIDGEGSKTTKYSIRIKLANKKIIQDIIWLSKSCCLNATYGTDKSKRRKMDGENIIKESKSYCAIINKSELYNIPLKRFAPVANDKLIPLDGLKYICSKHNIQRQIINCKERASKKVLKNCLGFLEKYSDILDQEDKKIIKNYGFWMKSKAGFLKVKRIIKTNKKEKVYDISVKNTERFYTGTVPILVHNSGYKGFRLTYKKDLELPEDPRKRMSFVNKNRKLFIEQLLKKLNKKHHPFIDQNITIDPMRVVRVLGTVHSSTGYVSSKIKITELNKPIEKILDNIPNIFGKGRSEILKKEMTPEEKDSSPRPRLLQLAEDVTDLASLPIFPRDCAYFVTNRVLGVKKGFIPIFIYQNSQTYFQEEIKRLQEKYGLGTAYIFQYLKNKVVICLKVMQRRQLQKVLNESSSRTKHDFKKYKRIYSPFIMHRLDEMPTVLKGMISRAHLIYLNPKKSPRGQKIGWDKLELIKATK